jgi:hypothetical protein
LFFNLSPLTHPKNGIIFLDEECEVFMNERNKNGGKY